MLGRIIWPISTAGLGQYIVPYTRSAEPVRVIGVMTDPEKKTMLHCDVSGQHI